MGNVVLRTLRKFSIIPRSWTLGNSFAATTFRRTLRINRANGNFPDNYVSNTKYTIFTFLFHTLYEQFFKSHLNRYFLLIACLQLWREVTPVNPITIWLPLTTAVAITAVKSAYEDFRRYKSDRDANNSAVHIVDRDSKQLVQRCAKDIQVGDILRVRENESFPCDLVLLCSSDPQGYCYIQTASLDGEIDLKDRLAPKSVLELYQEDGIQAIHTFEGFIECPHPNNQIYSFEAQLVHANLNSHDRWNNQRLALSSEQLLLQACVLKNVEWVYGVAVYTGNETKCGMNKHAVRGKQSNADIIIDRIAIVIFCAQLIIVGLFGFISTYQKHVGQKIDTYLHYTLNHAPWYDFMIMPIRFLLLSANMIPISLKVTLDLVKWFFSYLIANDLDMYDEEMDYSAVARNSEICADLGQVQYLFTDKTGTLTENKMLLQKISCNEIIYENSQPENPTFVAHNLELALSNLTSKEYMLFKALALCHTCKITKHSDAERHLVSHSPDEYALVTAAEKFGFQLIETNTGSMTINCRNTRETFNILHILKFTSDRKRMSILLQKQDSIFLFTKGSDDVIFERLSTTENGHEVFSTQSHLNSFGQCGLRTMAVTVKKVNAKETHDWLQRVSVASAAIEQRQAQLDVLYDELERNLVLLGATAIEDKLQDKVSESIAMLREADIAVWMLTGDKFETAQQIAQSCQLLNQEQPLFHVSGTTVHGVHQSLMNCTKEINDLSPTIDIIGVYSIVVTGATLDIIMKHFEKEFSQVALGAISVICCRVTPSQKGQIVRLVKGHGQITCSIGDGGNDVAMIQESHIGIGIAGKEGLQAARAADFALAKFKYLIPLLLVHGHYSHARISYIAQFIFYKNIVLALLQVLYNMFTNFSGASPYLDLSLAGYNFVWTGIYVFTFCLDRNVNKDVLLNHPDLYRYTQNGGSLTTSSIVLWLLSALYHAIVVLLLTTFTYWNMGNPSAVDKEYFGLLVFTILLPLVAIMYFCTSRSIHLLNTTTISLTLLCYILYLWLYDQYYGVVYHVWPQALHVMPGTFEMFGIMRQLIRDPYAYLDFILCIIVGIAPVVLFLATKLQFFPNPVEHYVHERENNRRRVFAPNVTIHSYFQLNNDVVPVHYDSSSEETINERKMF